ncbi:MAG: hypothetical protein V1788_01900 [Nanoarchaeota archaeon]
MDLEAIFPRSYGSDIIIDTKEFGKLKFHNWLSKDTLVFIGRKNDKPSTIEINSTNIQKEKGIYSLKKPYEIIHFKEPEKTYYDIQLNELGIKNDSE